MEDLIRRSDAISRKGVSAWLDNMGYPRLANAVMDKKRFPSADRPQGEWIKNDLGTVICSECKRPRRDNRVNHINFCNSCGARMRPELQGKHFDSIIIDESAMKGADDDSDNV